jgi:SMI1 / KNR4 family (SUKH-1)
MPGLIGGLKLRPGATDDEIVRCTRELEVKLPADFMDFLKTANGATGFIRKGRAYVDLWSTDTMIESNRGYQVAKFAPGLLLFGSDGGGEAFGFDMRSVPWSVVVVPFVGMFWDDAVVNGTSFSDFLERLCDGRSPEFSRNA